MVKQISPWLGSVKTFLVLSLTALVVACSSPPPPAPPPQPAFYTHTVQNQGETLAAIAKWYTGSPKNWVSILNYNQGLDIRRIRIGTEIRIPKDMLVKEKPMPKSVLAVAAEKPAKIEDTEAQVAVEGANLNEENTQEVAAAAENQPANTLVIEKPDSVTPESVNLENKDPLEEEAPPQEKSLLTRLQEGALKAKEATLGGSDEAAKKAEDTAPVIDQQVAPTAIAPSQEVAAEVKEAQEAASEQAKAAQEAAKAQSDAAIEAAKKQTDEAVEAAKAQSDAAFEAAKKEGQAAQEAASALIKKEEEQLKEAQAAAAQAGQNVEQPRVKTRDELLKELTEDY